MKLMETWGPWIAIGLVALGTILGGYLTLTYRTKSLSGQAEIKRMNEAIDSAVGRVEVLNNGISKTSQSTEELAIRIDKITKEIKGAQDKLGDIAMKNSKLTGDNIKLTGNVKSIAETVVILQQELGEITIQNKDLVKQNLSLTKKATGLVKEISDFQTGGETFCWLHAGFDDEINKYVVVLNIKGTDRLRNVRMTIMDNILLKDKR